MTATLYSFGVTSSSRAGVRAGAAPPLQSGADPSAADRRRVFDVPSLVNRSGAGARDLEKVGCRLPATDYRPMNLLISAGEASGDLHGARLLAALTKKRPDVSAFGMGGERLEAEGLLPVVRSDALSVVGVFEVFEKLPALSKALTRMTDAAGEKRPDAAILIDFPDFNALLARRLHRAGVPLLYYVSPQVWAWPGRARAIAGSPKDLTLFPFEAEIYLRSGRSGCRATRCRRRAKLASDPPSRPPRGRLVFPGRRAARAQALDAELESAVALSAVRPGVVAIRAPVCPEILDAGTRRVAFDGRHPPSPGGLESSLGHGNARGAFCGAPLSSCTHGAARTRSLRRSCVSGSRS